MSGALIAANGTKISTYGVRRIRIRLSGLEVTHPFHVAAVPRPILGSDFFAAQGLLIDVGRQQLVRLPHRRDTTLVLPAASDRAPRTVSGLHVERSNPVERLLDDFPELLVSKFDSTLPPAHGVQHVCLLYTSPSPRD